MWIEKGMEYARTLVKDRDVHDTEREIERRIVRFENVCVRRNAKERGELRSTALLGHHTG